MKTIYAIVLFSFLVLCNSCNSEEENLSTFKYKDIITKYTEIKQINSREVNDTFYVYVRLPKHYEASNKRYPVLYLLDGDISFDMATSVVRYLQIGDDVPDLIIVAPGYGTLLSDNETNFRERDYTITKNEKFKDSGGSAEYLNFLQKELIPLIDSNYRTNEKRILNGYSLSGLFTINTLISSPETFDHYIAGSPYLAGDIKYITEKIKKLNIATAKKVFISFGELEDQSNFRVPIKTVSDNLSIISNLKLEFMEFKNGTHYTCPPEALAYGLKFIFNQGITRKP